MKYELKTPSRTVVYTADIIDSGCGKSNLGRAVMAAIKGSIELCYVNMRGAYMDGVDFDYADLRGARMDYSDLNNADLSNANIVDVKLHGADLRGARLPYHDITPVIGDIHKDVYASAKGALRMSKWHSSCGTIHCWAGWIVMLAGDEGRNLERIIGTGVAAALILMKSDPGLATIPDWHASERDALREMRRLAK